MTAATATRSVEVFRPGTFTPLSGEPVTFSAADMAALAAGYDAAAAPAPAVVGHPDIDAPAYGWATAFRWDADAGRLLADLGELEPQFADAVAAGRYKRISMALFSPDAPNNPKPGAWYPKHIGFLGAAAPAVSGLKPVAFSGGQISGDQIGVHVFEFGDLSALRDVAGLFRSLREWIIEKFGSDAADKTLPTWTIGWIDEAARPSEPEPASFPVSSFAAPPEIPPVTDAAAIAAAAAESQQLRTRIAELETERKAAAHAANLAFAETLVAEGRLTPAVRERAVALLDALPADGASQVAFAEGDAQRALHPRQLLAEILGALPPVVSFGQAYIGPAPGAGLGAAAFAAPDGMGVDPGSAELHAKALAYQAAHPTIDYMAAVAAVNR